jgi:hypothetical protein
MKKTLNLLLATVSAGTLLAQPAEVSLTASASAVCNGDTVTITTSSSDRWATYELRDGLGQTVDGPIQGTGSALEFQDVPTTDVTYNVFAHVYDAIGIEMNGYNEYFQSDLPATFDYSTAFTYECWAKVPTPGSANYHPFLSFGSAAQSDVEVYGRTNDMAIIINRDLTTSNYLTFPVPPNDTWFHLAVTFDGTTWSIYYDGVLQSASSSSGSNTITKRSGTNVQTGVVKYAGFPITQNYQKHASGIFDEVRVWDYARSANDISANMGTCLLGTETGLMAHYTFNPGTGTAVADQTGNVTGEIVNMGSENYIIADGSSIPCPYDASRTMGDMPSVTVTTVNTNVLVALPTLESAQVGATYQWLDCNAASPISGEIFNDFSATTDGDYAVEVTYNGCVDTSVCYNIAGLAVEELAASVSLYPNPVAEVLFVEAPTTVQAVTIVDARGVVVAYETVMNGRINVADLPKGFYLLQVKTAEGIVQKSFVKA